MNSRDSRAHRLAALVIFFFNPLRTTICLNSFPSSSVTPPVTRRHFPADCCPVSLRNGGKKKKKKKSAVHKLFIKKSFLGGGGGGVSIRTALSHFQFHSTIRSIYPRSPLQGQTTKQLITARVMLLPLPAFQDRTS